MENIVLILGKPDVPVRPTPTNSGHLWNPPWAIPPSSSRQDLPPHPFAPIVPSEEASAVELVAASAALSISSGTPRNAPRGAESAIEDSTANALHDRQGHGLNCARCQQPIVGDRYQCATCSSSPESYNLCAACETRSYIVHDDGHIFFKLPRPVKRQIESPLPLLPRMYLDPPGLLLDDTYDDVNPEGYLRYLRHRKTLCDRCHGRVVGKWYRCAYCAKDLCHACEKVDTHHDTHLFVVFKAELDLDRFREFTDLDRPAPLIPYAVY